LLKELDDEAPKTFPQVVSEWVCFAAVVDLSLHSSSLVQWRGLRTVLSLLVWKSLRLT
jgi:hypothetical protein